MLIFNKNLSVCPITTHLPIKLITKNLNANDIKNKIILINNFYKKTKSEKTKNCHYGIENPHCESIHHYNEDLKIIKPIVLFLKSKKYNVKRSICRTLSFKKNRINYDVIIGMYHDQVLTPIKTLYEYNAINITLGLPFIRISPDHGPNEKMLGRNLSNHKSLLLAINFLDKIDESKKKFRSKLFD